MPYPLTVTVYDMLECHSMDILPVSRSGHLLEGESEPSQNRALFAVTDPWNWAFLTFEVRNTYGLPFEVVAKRVEGSDPFRHVIPVPHSYTLVQIPRINRSRRQSHRVQRTGMYILVTKPGCI